MPAPGVPHIHLSEVESVKSTFGFIASNGIKPAACVISTPIMLTISRPCATSGARSTRAEAVEVTHVSNASPTSLPQLSMKSSGSTHDAPSRFGTVSSVKPIFGARPASKKCMDGKQSSDTSTRLPRNCPSGNARMSLCIPSVTLSQVVIEPLGTLMMRRQ